MDGRMPAMHGALLAVSALAMVLGVVNLFGVEGLAAAAAATLMPVGCGPGRRASAARSTTTLDSTNAEALRRAAAGETGPLWILARRADRGARAAGAGLVGAGGELRGDAADAAAGRPRRCGRSSRRSGSTTRWWRSTGRPELFALKWPNDVLLSGGKLAGILLEAVNGGALVDRRRGQPRDRAGALDAGAGGGAAGVAARGDRARGDAGGLPRPARPGGRGLGGPADRRGLRAAARRLARPRHPARRADRRAAAGPHADRALRDGGRERRAGARHRRRARRAAGCRHHLREPPMLLAIDVGNTNMVFALHDGEKLVAEWRCRTERQRTADEYYVWLRQLMDLNGIPAEVRAVVVSSVVPQVVFNLRVLSDRYFQHPPAGGRQARGEDRPGAAGRPDDQRRRRPAGQHRRRLRPLRRRSHRRRLRHRDDARRRRRRTAPTRAG